MWSFVLCNALQHMNSVGWLPLFIVNKLFVLVILFYIPIQCSSGVVLLTFVVTGWIIFLSSFLFFSFLLSFFLSFFSIFFSLIYPFFLALFLSLSIYLSINLFISLRFYFLPFFFYVFFCYFFLFHFLFFGTVSVSRQHGHSWVVDFQYHNRGHRKLVPRLARAVTWSVPTPVARGHQGPSNTANCPV